MVKICKTCGKKIGIFGLVESNEQGDIICKECSDKQKLEQEQQQKQKDEEEYRIKLARALTKNSQWEYKILNALQDEGTLNQLGSEGWQLVAVIPSNSPPSSPAQPPQPNQNNPEQKPPEQPQQSNPQPQQPVPSEISYIFKRKI